MRHGLAGDAEGGSCLRDGEHGVIFTADTDRKFPVWKTRGSSAIPIRRRRSRSAFGDGTPGSARPAPDGSSRARRSRAPGTSSSTASASSNGTMRVSSPRWPEANGPAATAIVLVMVVTAVPMADLTGNGGPRRQGHLGESRPWCDGPKGTCSSRCRRRVDGTDDGKGTTRRWPNGN